MHPIDISFGKQRSDVPHPSILYVFVATRVLAIYFGIKARGVCFEEKIAN